ncbi:MAG: V-type ATPase subunit [Candidatus Aenigmarchaeota archaeon]|nr:V-type ATPase subunit [Candidatus Aenigmarchaeota archaeon]
MFDFLRNEYAAARLRAMKGGLLKPGDMERLASSKNLSEFVSHLERTDYGETLLNFFEKDVSTIEKELDKFYVGMLYKVAAFYPKSYGYLFDFFIKEWEARNLKIIIKSVVTGEDIREFLIKTKGIEWDSISKLNSLGGIIDFLSSRGIYERLGDAIGLSEKFGFFVFDFCIDREYSDCCREKIGGKVKILNEFLKLKNDMINIRNIVRGLNAGVNFEEFRILPTRIPKDFFGIRQKNVLFDRLKKLGIFEMDEPSVLDNGFLLESVFCKKMISLSERFLREDPFGPGLLLYVLMRRRGEINKIKTIMKFVKEDLPRDYLNTILNS